MCSVFFDIYVVVAVLFSTLFIAFSYEVLMKLFRTSTMCTENMYMHSYACTFFICTCLCLTKTDV